MSSDCIFLETLIDHLDYSSNTILLRLDILSLYNKHPYELHRYLIEGQWRLYVEQRIKFRIIESNLNNDVKTLEKEHFETEACFINKGCLRSENSNARNQTSQRTQINFNDGRKKCWKEKNVYNEINSDKQKTNFERIDSYNHNHIPQTFCNTTHNTEYREILPNFKRNTFIFMSHPSLIQLTYIFINMPPLKICFTDMTKIQRMKDNVRYKEKDLNNGRINIKCTDEINFKRTKGKNASYKNNYAENNQFNRQRKISRRDNTIGIGERNDYVMNLENKFTILECTNDLISTPHIQDPVINCKNVSISNIRNFSVEHRGRSERFKVKELRLCHTSSRNSNSPETDQILSKKPVISNRLKSSNSTNTPSVLKSFNYPPCSSALVKLSLRLFKRQTEHRMVRQVYECTEGMCRNKSLWVVQYKNSIIGTDRGCNSYIRNNYKELPHIETQNNKETGGYDSNKVYDDGNLMIDCKNLGTNEVNDSFTLSSKNDELSNISGVFDMNRPVATHAQLFHFSISHYFILPLTEFPLYCRGCQSDVTEKMEDRIVEKWNKMNGWWNNRTVTVIMKEDLWDKNFEGVNNSDSVNKLNHNADILTDNNISVKHLFTDEAPDKFPRKKICRLSETQEIPIDASSVFNILGYFTRDEEHNDVFMAIKIQKKKNQKILADVYNYEEYEHKNKEYTQSLHIKKESNSEINLITGPDSKGYRKNALRQSEQLKFSSELGSASSSSGYRKDTISKFHGESLSPLVTRTLPVSKESNKPPNDIDLNRDTFKNVLLSVLALLHTENCNILVFTDESWFFFGFFDQLRGVFGDSIELLRDFNMKCHRKDGKVLIIQDETLECRNTVEDFDWVFRIRIKIKDKDKLKSEMSFDKEWKNVKLEKVQIYSNGFKQIKYEQEGNKNMIDERDKSYSAMKNKNKNVDKNGCNGHIKNKRDIIGLLNTRHGILEHMTERHARINQEKMSSSKKEIDSQRILELSYKLGINSSKLIYTVGLLLKEIHYFKPTDVYEFIEEFMIY